MGKLSYVNSSGLIEHLDAAGALVWRTGAAPAFLLPAASNALAWSGNISFPDPPHGNVIYYARHTDPTTHISTYSGSCFSVIRGGEWNPSGSGIYNLPRTLLGVMPANCNYLDATLNLSAQTTVPTSMLGIAVSNYQKAGEDIVLDGGCAKLEGSRAFRRVIKIVPAAADNGDGTRNVYLERHQSIAVQASSVGEFGFNFKGGVQSYDGSATSAWEGEFTHDGDPSGWMATWLSVVSSGDLHMMRGGSNAPATTDTTSFASAWSATISVRPGYAHT